MAVLTPGPRRLRTVIPKPTNPGDVPIPIPDTILVKAEPSTAGRTAGNLPSGIVPDERLSAFKFVKSAPDPSVNNNVPSEFGRTTVAFPE